LIGTETGLKGYWKLNDSLLDETTNNNDLTNVNSAVFSTDVPFGGSPPPPFESSTTTPYMIHGTVIVLSTYLFFVLFFGFVLLFSL